MSSRKDKYICIKDCSKGNVFIHYYFREGQSFYIRTWDRSSHCYIECSPNQDITVDKDFVNKNFKIADTESLLLAEIDFMFDSIFFEL